MSHAQPPHGTAAAGTRIVIVLGAHTFPNLFREENPTQSRAFLASKRDVFSLLSPGAVDVLDQFSAARLPDESCKEIHDFLERNAAATELIVYYVGHGGFLEDQAHYLALRETKQGHEHFTALRTATLASTLKRGFPHGRILLILDCCFAAAAASEFQAADAISTIIERQTSRGVALLVASSKDSAALVPANANRTMFSDGLCAVLSEGISNIPRRISPRELCTAIIQRIAEKYGDQPRAWPEVHCPQQQGGTSLADLPFFDNPALTSSSNSEALQSFLSSVRSEWSSRLDRSLLDTFDKPSVPYPDAAIDLKLGKSTSEIVSLGRAALERYWSEQAIELLECWLISRFLREAIRNRDAAIFRKRAFVYHIHYFLSSAIIDEPESERSSAIATLVTWLGGHAETYATTRDFAAFELGMCGASSAVPHLLQALKNRFETKAVRNYSAMSLGMLKATSALEELRDIYLSLSDLPLKTTVAHALLYIAASRPL